MKRAGCGRRCAFATVLLATGGTATAEDFPGPIRWGGTLTAATETVRRGITWSGGRAAVAAELSATTDQGWRASLGVDAPAYPETGARGEWTLAAARSWQWDADWSAQAALTRYALVGHPTARASGYAELGLTAAWRGRAFLSVAVSPDRRGFDTDQRVARSGGTAAVDFGVSERLAGRVSLDAGLGWATVVAGRRRDYAYGSVGVRWGLGPAQLQLSWIDSQAEQRGVAAPGQAGARFVAAASADF